MCAKRIENFENDLCNLTPTFGDLTSKEIPRRTIMPIVIHEILKYLKFEICMIYGIACVELWQVIFFLLLHFFGDVEEMKKYHEKWQHVEKETDIFQNLGNQNKYRKSRNKLNEKFI